MKEFSDAEALQELEQLLVIDEEKLLQEWKTQSLLLLQAVRLFGRTQAAVSQLELDTKEAEAHALIVAKRDGIDGIVKPTDEIAKRSVDLDCRVRKAREAEIEAQHRLTVLRGLVKAFEQRAMALKYVQLNKCPEIGSMQGVLAE